jgi:hypothetical protein
MRRRSLVDIRIDDIRICGSWRRGAKQPRVLRACRTSKVASEHSRCRSEPAPADGRHGGESDPRTESAGPLTRGCSPRSPRSGDESQPLPPARCDTAGPMPAYRGGCRGRRCCPRRRRAAPRLRLPPVEWASRRALAASRALSRALHRLSSSGGSSPRITVFTSGAPLLTRPALISALVAFPAPQPDRSGGGGASPGATARCGRRRFL